MWEHGAWGGHGKAKWLMNQVETLDEAPLKNTDTWNL